MSDFHNLKNLNCIGAMSVYDSKRSYGYLFFTNRRGVLEKFSLNPFYWIEFWSRKWNTWKNFCLSVEQSWRAERKEWFLFIPLFLWGREFSGVKKIEASNFFVHVRFFKTLCENLWSELWLWYNINFGVVLIVVWRFLVINMSFKLNWRVFLA